ncbi:hypothetical protein C8R44DRAFT_727549 [Mycena epipterygia]|nr:hypothetical protein C8R44DRAFT_727549 [Mycena epipterygia]
MSPKGWKVDGVCVSNREKDFKDSLRTPVESGSPIRRFAVYDIRVFATPRRMQPSSCGKPKKRQRKFKTRTRIRSSKRENSNGPWQTAFLVKLTPEIFGEENLGADHRMRYDLFTKKNAEGLQRPKRPSPTAASRGECERTTLGFEKKKPNPGDATFYKSRTAGSVVQAAKLETNTLERTGIVSVQHKNPEIIGEENLGADHRARYGPVKNCPRKSPGGYRD